MRLLIVEDNRNLVANLFDYFEARGYTLDAAPDGATGLHLAVTQRFDAIVLDWMLPRLDGREVLRGLRDAGRDVPVLMLTARDELLDKIAGFRAGADDYLTKPFALSELLVRVQALMRRPAAASAGSGGVVLDPGAHAIVHEGLRVPLTPTEFRLLSALAASPGVVLRRASLVAAGWTDGAVVHDNTLDAYIARIRRKLRQAETSVSLETARGVGYVLR